MDTSITELNVRTNQKVEFKDITSEIQNVVSKSKIKDGICIVFVPHTTAGITINENADPSVTKDIINQINKTIPFDADYAHSEGNSAAHIKASMMGFSLNLIIQNSKLLLGVWQGVYFCEFDGPRNRKVIVRIF